RPVRASFLSVLCSEGSWKCLLLTALIAGCASAVLWCRLSQLERLVIDFSAYPIQRTHRAPACEDAFLYVPLGFLGLLYLVYLVECYHCSTRLRLARAIDAEAVRRRISLMRTAEPVVWWKAICYHYVRRKRHITRYRNGDAYTSTQIYYERVDSHSASATFSHAYCGYQDVSKNLILDASSDPIIKFRFSKGFAFSNIEAASEFEEQRSRFFSEHSHFDDYMEMREGLDLAGAGLAFREHLVARRDSKKSPWYCTTPAYWILSFLLLSWPLRILVECRTSRVRYDVTKVFGTNYVIGTNNSEEAEPTHRASNDSLISGSTLQIVNEEPYYEATPSQTSPNDAILLASGLHAIVPPIERIQQNNTSFSPQDEYQVRRPPPNLNPITYSNTTDSLQIYENCALVPSYSEALLMTPNGDVVNRLESSRRNSSESRRGIAIMSSIINTRRKTNEAPDESVQSSWSNYSLRTRNNNSISRVKNQNRRSWNGIAHVRPVHHGGSVLYYASPLLPHCPDDPFGGAESVMVPEEPPPSYEEALLFPRLRALARSATT
ncbi:transmembrane protein 151B-like, partial [Ctenocephalides felis]|uniref:transmembrane protein 151B-like n=1 Tax=Ctenocephalides felis TaxID=7515 RepID=UPI000E6E1979